MQTPPWFLINSKADFKNPFGYWTVPPTPCSNHIIWYYHLFEKKKVDFKPEWIRQKNRQLVLLVRNNAELHPADRHIFPMQRTVRVSNCSCEWFERENHGSAFHPILLDKDQHSSSKYYDENFKNRNRMSSNSIYLMYTEIACNIVTPSGMSGKAICSGTHSVISVSERD